MLDFVTTHPTGTALLILIMWFLTFLWGFIIISLLQRVRNLEHKQKQILKEQKFLREVYNADMPIPPSPPAGYQHPSREAAMDPTVRVHAEAVGPRIVEFQDETRPYKPLTQMDKDPYDAGL